MRWYLPILLLAACTVDQPPPHDTLAGDWKGLWTRNGDTINVRMHFERTDSGDTGNFSSQDLRVVEIPLSAISVHAHTCAWAVSGDASTTTFTGRVRGDSLLGSFTENGEHGTFVFARTEALPALHDTDITFRSGSAQLAGTVLLPAGKGPFPGIVFLHGSGAEGRWASRFLAQSFAEAGIAALIFDKRGVGASTGDWHVAGFDTLAADAHAAIAALRRIPGVDTHRVGIHGHSQGGTLAPLVAEQDSTLAFVVASAAAGVPLDSMERYSVLNSMVIDTMNAADKKAAAHFVDAIVATAYHHAPYETMKQAWQAVADRPWAFEPPPPDDPYWTFSRMTATYDPLELWRRVRIPALVLFGEADERVPPQLSMERIRIAYEAAPTHHLRMLTFPNADHTFRVPSAGHVWPRSASGYPEWMIEQVKEMLEQ